MRQVSHPEWSASVSKALSALQRGGVIAYPTETFYGLGGRIDAPEALDRIWELKERPVGSPLPLLVPGRPSLQELGLTPRAPGAGFDALTRTFWPGPLTLVVAATAGLDARLVGPDGGVAVRVSSHPLARRLVDRLGKPITATSANLRGQPPATAADDVLASPIAANLDFVLAGGQTAGVQPSTVLRLVDRRAAVIREGAIERAELFAVLHPLGIALG